MKIKDEEQLINQVNNEVNRAIRWQSSEVQSQIADGYKAYYGYHKKAKAGYASNVERVVFEGVEAIRSPIVEMFTMSDDLVKYQTEDDSIDPRLMVYATQEVNKQINRVNDGYSVFRDWFLDGLLAKNGIVKSYWNECYKVETHEFEGLNQQQLDFLLQEEDTDPESLHLKTRRIENLNTGDFYEEHEGTIDRIKDVSGLCIQNVAPEEFIIAERNRDLKNPEFCAHRSRYTVAELKEMFPDHKAEIEDTSGNDSADWEEVIITRHDVDSTYSFNNPGANHDPEQRKIWLYECYLKSSFITGESRLFQVFTDLTTIFSFAEVDESPFHSVCPVPIPHKFYGLSIPDILTDIQSTKTEIVRGIVDSARLSIHPRYQAPKGQYDAVALLSNKAGSVIETEGADIVPLQTAPLPQQVGLVLELMEANQASRTGVSKQTLGLDDNLLKSNVSEGSVMSIRDQGEARLRQIVREYANTGVKSLFARCYKLLRENDARIHVSEEIGEWSFTQLPERVDVDVTVALGRTARSEEANKKMQGYQIAKEAGLLTPEYERKYFSDILKLQGVKDIRAYIPTQEEIDAFQEEQAMKQAELAKKIPPDPLQQMQAETAAKEQQNREYELKIQEMNAQAKLAEIELQKSELELKQDRENKLHEREMLKLQTLAIETDATIRLKAQEVGIKGQQVINDAEATKADLMLKANQAATSDLSGGANV